jgi:hypothetical protein
LLLALLLLLLLLALLALLLLLLALLLLLLLLGVLASRRAEQSCRFRAAPDCEVSVVIHKLPPRVKSLARVRPMW